jgi:hypothetical protein
MPSDAGELLPQDVLLSLAGEHLAGLKGVVLAPEIPPRKLGGARHAHGVHLRANEPIVVLYDSSMLGGGGDGFIATPSQFCWKNFLEYPRRAGWDDLAHMPIVALDRHVEIARGEVPAPWVTGAPERLHAFLRACSRRMRAGATPYRARDREIELRAWADTLLTTARRKLGELDWVHYRPSIPPKMLAAARIVHARHLSADEEILVLYDDTLFGSGNDGIVLTERGVYWRNFWGAAEAIAWGDMDAGLLSSDGDLLFVEPETSAAPRRRIDLRMRPGMARIVADTLRELSRARGQPG